LIDVITDLQINEVQPREFLHTVSQMSALQQQAVNELRELEDQFNSSLTPKPKAG
jgi:hypothetical protein